MTIRIKLPSKTFLLGEYLALLGEPCLIVNTKPQFELHACVASTPKVSGIPTGSPAAQFIADNQAFFQHYQLDFMDPHQGAGGLGASSAQFLAAYLLYQQSKFASQPTIDIQALLNCYQQYSGQAQGLPPSGADVVAQLHGKITYFDRNNSQVEMLNWPFADYGFMLLRTGHKVATHQHLLTLNKRDIAELPRLAKTAHQCLQANDSHGFIDCIRDYRVALTSKQWLVDHTQQLLQRIDKQKGVVVSKGCGALGADVMLVIVERDQQKALLSWCQQQALVCIATQHDVAASSYQSLNDMNSGEKRCDTSF